MYTYISNLNFHPLSAICLKKTMGSGMPDWKKSA